MNDTAAPGATYGGLRADDKLEVTTPLMPLQVRCHGSDAEGWRLASVAQPATGSVKAVEHGAANED